MHLLERLATWIESLVEGVGRSVSWLTTLMVLVVCYDVLTRYLLRKSSVAVQELEWHLFAVLFLLAAAYTLKHQRHVRVDILYTRFPERIRVWIDLLGTLLFLIPFSVLVIWTSWTFVVDAWVIRESSPDPGGLPARYLLKACIPLGFALVLLQGVAWLIRSLKQLQKSRP